MFDLKHIGVAKSTFGSHSSASGDLQTLIQMQGVIYKLGTLKLKLTIMNLSSKINPVSAKHLQPTKTLVGTFWHFVSLKIEFGAHMLILEVWLWNYGFQIPIHTSRFNLPLDLFLSYCPQWQELIWEICQGQKTFTHHFCFFSWPWNCPEEGLVLSFTLQPLLMHLTALTGVSAVMRALYLWSVLSVLIILLQDCYWREPGKSPAAQENRTVCSIHPGIKCLL